MSHVVLTSENLEAALEAARRDESPVQINPVKVCYMAAFIQTSSDGGHEAHYEERIFFDRGEAEAYLRSHPRQVMHFAKGAREEVREMQMGWPETEEEEQMTCCCSGCGSVEEGDYYPLPCQHCQFC